LHVIERADDRVIKGRAAARIDALERFVQFSLVVGEVLVRVEVIFVVKIHHESFVLRIAGLHERKSGGSHLRAFLAHAPAVIDDQPHSYGNVFAAENRELLLDLVFEDSEAVLTQVRNEISAVVDDRGMEHHEIDAALDNAMLRLRDHSRWRRRRRGFYWK